MFMSDTDFFDYPVQSGSPGGYYNIRCRVQIIYVTGVKICFGLDVKCRFTGLLCHLNQSAGVAAVAPACNNHCNPMTPG